MAEIHQNSEQERDFDGARSILTSIFAHRISLSQNVKIPTADQMQLPSGAIFDLPFDPDLATYVSRFLDEFAASSFTSPRATGPNKPPLPDLMTNLKQFVGLGGPSMKKADIAAASELSYHAVTERLQVAPFYLADYTRGIGADAWQEFVTGLHLPMDLQLRTQSS